MIYRGSVTADLPETDSTPTSIQRCMTEDILVADVSNVPVAGAGKRARFLVYVTPNDINFDFSGTIEQQNNI